MYILKQVIMLIAFLCVNSWAMNDIDEKLKKLEEERSEIIKNMKEKYGDSTVEYKIFSRLSCVEINEKIEELRREKIRIGAKV
jgi:polyhydroxyalkanoate synthesis regulator phasin